MGILSQVNFALHWQVPAAWHEESFDDSPWPSAITYTNSTIGLHNKASYTNFTDIFEEAVVDAEFICPPMWFSG